MYMKSHASLLCALLVAGGSAYGGSFTADFATQDTSQFIYNASGSLADGSAWVPVIANNCFQLTTNQNFLAGSFSPNDFDNGAAIQAFTAKFKLQFGPGSGNAADGAAFSFGSDVNQNNTGYAEVGAGGNAVAVSFHTFTSNGGPAVDVYLYGTQIAHYPMAKGDMVNSQLQDVVIQLNRNSTLNVSYRGQVIATNLYLPNWGPTPGFFIITAKTGGENEVTDIAAVNIATTLFTAPMDPVLTSTPTNFTVAEGGSATFSATLDGTGPFSIQWIENGLPIPDATNQVLTLSPVYYADNNAQIAIQVSGSATITSPAVTLKVIRNVTPPTVLSVTSDTTFTSVLVKYSEPVSDTALTPSNYSIDQGLAVLSVTRLNDSTVQLTTTPQVEGTGYNLSIHGVQDMSTTPNTIAANTVVRFQTFEFMLGTVTHQKYTGFNDGLGYDPNNLFSDPRFPNMPDRRELLSIFEYPGNGSWFNTAVDSDKLFFDTMETFFIPPVTGDYVFFISLSDHAWLYLSTDDQPANKVMIAGATGGYSDPRGWLIGNGYDPSFCRSDLSANNLWPNGPTITLQAGKRYYMLMVHHTPDWAGGSWFDATYKLASAADPANGTLSALTGNVVGTYIDPTGTSVTFTKQPVNATVKQGAIANFSGGATGVSPYGANVNFQWQTAPAGSSTFVDIPGSTLPDLQTMPSTMADNGRQYRLVATVPPVSETSSTATLTVTADTAPPVASAGAMLGNVAGTISIGVGFDKTVDDATGAAIANYSVSSGTITAINWYTNRFTGDSKNPQVMIRKQTALLTVTGFSGASGTLTIHNVKDLFNNVISSAPVPFIVDTKMKWGIVGGNELGGWNAAVPVAAMAPSMFTATVRRVGQL